MNRLKNLFDNNRHWAQQLTTEDPDFFSTLSRQQTPEYLWIGCSDSRVPANEITGLMPGEIFVHRNVANVVVHTDLNCLSVIQYAVEVLKVKHIMVVGHYRCGGVECALHNRQMGLIDNWLRHVQDIRNDHTSLFEQIDACHHGDVLCELNVITQTRNVCLTTIVQQAWKNGQELYVHGWVYGLNDGLLQDLGVCVSSNDETSLVYKSAIEMLAIKRR